MKPRSAQSAADRCVLALSSVGGLGYLPRAPGTWGTLGALPIWWALSQQSTQVFLLATVAATAFSIWVSHRAEAIYGGHDVQHIVIDEVVGLLWAALAVPWAWPQVVPTFVLFRLLDATKPWPIRAIDERVDGGLGVVLDDVAAGMATCALMHGAHYLCKGWW